MSVSPLMTLGVKAMHVSYASLQATGHNIANANVEGFSRQRAEMATAEGQFLGGSFFGKGADVQAITRAHNEFLTRQAAATRSLAAMDTARLDHLRRLEPVFQPGEQGLGHASSELMLAMTDLASRPGDLATRNVVLARASDLAARFNEAALAFDVAQANVEEELQASVEQINSLTTSIAQVNQRIAALGSIGRNANDLQDERDRLIGRLSELVQVTRVPAEDGTLAIFAGGGQRLVLGTEAAPLRMLPDPADPQRWAIGVDDFGNQRILDQASLGGGKVGGLLRFQNDDLVAARVQVGRLAVALAGALNTQQQLGLNLLPPAGTVPSDPMFSVGGPQVQNHSGNARDGSGNFLANLTLTLTVPAELQASEYELAEDPAAPGTWQLTRLSDGLRRTVADGDTVDGMLIQFGTPGPQAGDRFRLQPVSFAAADMQSLLKDPRALAAASALVASTPVGNAGSVRAAQLSVNVQPLPVPGARADITFADDAGNYTWELFDATGTSLGTGGGTWVPGGTVPEPPADINGFTLTLSGVPRTGDRLQVAPTPASGVASNNGNALALVALGEARIVGGRSPTDAWALALTEMGVRVQSGRTAADISQAVAEQTERARASEAGVNLDEEAARLIQFQQSYQAAAKVLQVAQSIFDTLLETARS